MSHRQTWCSCEVTRVWGGRLDWKRAWSPPGATRKWISSKAQLQRVPARKKVRSFFLRCYCCQSKLHLDFSAALTQAEKLSSRWSGAWSEHAETRVEKAQGRYAVKITRARPSLAITHICVHVQYFSMNLLWKMTLYYCYKKLATSIHVSASSWWACAAVTFLFSRNFFKLCGHAV